MKIITQIGILFGLCWLSQCIEAVLPVAFPASVIGLILLLILLMLKIFKVHHIREASDFLIGNLQFFFIPVSVSIIEYTDLILDNGVAFLVICVSSMVLTFGATAWAVMLTMRWLERRRG